MDASPLGSETKYLNSQQIEDVPPISDQINNVIQEKCISSNPKDACVPVPSGKGISKQQIPDKKININIGEEKIKSETDNEVTELLGSVTIQNCPGTRTSARVIQKMKLDQTRPLTPPTLEKDSKNIQKTPSQIRTSKTVWTNLERNYFFEALNEFGKDFEAIGNFINSKLKRKGSTDVFFKTKDQVRQHFYQTFHKISKYIRFSDEVKKPAQELYALINYGEMRRRVQYITDKHFMKLKMLVYQGHITMRCKGKNVRFKTPSCRALRKLNLLEGDSLEDIKLPPKIEVVITPADMESFGRVQTIAQNPHVRAVLPLHKKLETFIRAFEYKWRSNEVRLAEEAAKLFPPTEHNTSVSNLSDPLDPKPKDSIPTIAYQDPKMCFLPKPGVTIHRPLVSISEHLSSVNISLSSYEERMGVKVRSESLTYDRLPNKRQRTDSGSEKRSPDSKKQKNASSPGDERSDNSDIINNKDDTLPLIESDTHQFKSEGSGDELSDELNELLSDVGDTTMSKNCNSLIDGTKSEFQFSSSSLIGSNTSSSSSCHSSISAASKTKRNHQKSSRPSLNFKPLLSEDVIQSVRKGWTTINALDITIGDLYVVFGHDSKLELDYYWTDKLNNSIELENSMTGTIQSPLPENSPGGSIFSQKQQGMPYNPTECDDPLLMDTIANSVLSNKLKHLLLIANLSERMRKRQCSCGHICDRNAVKSRIEREIATKTFVSNQSLGPNRPVIDNNLFRQPVVPIRRPIIDLDPVQQLSSLTRQKHSKQVFVQRLLLPGGQKQTYDLLDVNKLHNNVAKTNKPMDQNCTKTSSDSHPTSSTDATNISTSEQDSPETSEYTSIADNPSTIDVKESPLETNKDTIENRNGLEPNVLTPTLLSEIGFDECSNTSLLNHITPMNLLRETSSNSRWLEENLHDFSLTSLLGHLDEINSTRDIMDSSSSLSIISESSVDFRHKFQEITAFIQSEEKD